MKNMLKSKASYVVRVFSEILEDLLNDELTDSSKALLLNRVHTLILESKTEECIELEFKNN